MRTIFATKKRKRWPQILLRALIVVVAAIGLIWWWVPWEFRYADPPDTSIEKDASHIMTARRILIVTAHPDDAEFYLGGTLLQLAGKASIQLVCVTDGDKSYYPFGDARAVGIQRRQEQNAAARKWRGLTPIYLGFDDGRFEPTETLIRALYREMLHFQPDLILTFDPTWPKKLAHGDHRKAGDAATLAWLRLKRSVPMAYFSTGRPNLIVPYSLDWAERMNLLWTHASQFNASDRNGRVNSMIVNTAKANGKRVGKPYAEAFFLATGQPNQSPR